MDQIDVALAMQARRVSKALLELAGALEEQDLKLVRVDVSEPRRVAAPREVATMYGSVKIYVTQDR